MRELKLCRFRW